MSPAALAQLSASSWRRPKTSPARIAALYVAAGEKRLGETALVALAIAEPACRA